MLTKHLRQPQFGIYFEESSDGNGSGGGNGNGEPSGEPKKKVTIDGEHILPDEILQKFKSTMEKHGDAKEFAEVLYNENKKLRDKTRTLEEKVIDDNHVAVPKDVQEKIETIKDLGGFEEVIEKAQNYDDLSQEKSQLERKITNKEIASIYNYNQDVLNDLTAGHDVEVREVETNDGKQEQAFIQFEDGDEAELSSWLEENKEPYLPALQNEQQSGSRRRVTRQSSDEGNGKGESSAVQKIKERNKKEAEAENPLM